MARPTDPAPYIQSISALISQEDFSTAEKACRKAQKKFPKNPQIELMTADVLAKLGKFQPARFILEKLLVSMPNQAIVHTMLGLIDCEQGRDADALRQFERAMRVEPSHADASFFAASLYLKSRAVDKAEVALQQCLAAQPGHIGALRTYGELLIKTNRYTDAIPYWHRVATAGALDADAATYLIQAETFGGDLETAVETAEQLAAAFPENLMVQEALAMASVRAGYPAKAIAVCDKLIDFARNPTSAIAFKATALAEAGQIGAAEKLLAMDRFVSVSQLPAASCKQLC